MTSAVLIDWLLRLLHIIPAIFLAGGVFFMWATLLPALNSVNDDTRESVLAAVRGKWSKIVMASTGLLLVTGLVNAVSAIKAYSFEPPLYHVLVLVKLLLAMGIFYITAVIGGRSKTAEKFRQRLSYWLGVNTALLIVLILVASLMRVSPRTPKPTEEPAVTASVSLSQDLDASVAIQKQ